MTKIHKLSDTVIESIAAGQVIERPSSVVKELVENSLDSSAQSIHIDLVDGGMTSICVIDDGKGMDRDDLMICFQKHTTSKLSQLDDLVTLTTYGFRGEALASMASSAHLEIRSRKAKNEFGYSITIEKSVPGRLIPVGMPKGTRVTVKNLFHYLPARKKIIKSSQAELAQCTNIVASFALAYPQVEFKLAHKGKTIVHLSKFLEYTKRVEKLFGISVLKDCFKIQENHPYHSIEGYIVKPHVMHHASKKQFLFVNNRPVRHDGTTKIIKDALKGLSDPRVQPVYILHIVVPADHIDVNIHPRKEQILFHDEKGYEQVLRSDITSSIESAFQARFESEFDIGMNASTADFVRDAEPLWYPSAPENNVAIQVQKTYIVFPFEHGLVLIDQHAAHERILYEQFKERYIKKKKHAKTITLSEPFIIPLGVLDTVEPEEYISALQKIGFSLKKKKGNLVVSGVPSYYEKRNIKRTIKEVLEDLYAGVNLVGIDSVADRTIAYLACRSAVKAGDSMTQVQMNEVIGKLFQTKNFYTCPHGRPTFVKIAQDDLEKMFKRR